MINTQFRVMVTLWRQEDECGRLQRAQAQVCHALVFKRTRSWVAFLQAVLRTGIVAHRKAIAAKPGDSSSIPGPT